MNRGTTAILTAAHFPRRTFSQIPRLIIYSRRRTYGRRRQQKTVCSLCSDENRPGLIRLHCIIVRVMNRGTTWKIMPLHTCGWITYLLQSYLSSPNMKMIQAPTLLPITICQRYVMLPVSFWTPWTPSRGYCTGKNNQTVREESVSSS